MTRAMTLMVLLVAAILEAGGDALVRVGLNAPAWPVRVACFAAGGVVLLSYGLVVNAPAWEFGRLLGVYVVFFFFVVAQLLSWFVFHQPPTRLAMLGGAFVIVGGLIMSAGSR